MSLTLAEAVASAKSCWICGWLVSIADNNEVALASQISVGFDSHEIRTLEPQKLPYDEENRQTAITRVAIWVDKRSAGGKFTYGGLIQKAGSTAPVHVSDMLDSGNLAGAEPYTARLRPSVADTRLFKFWRDHCTEEHRDLCGKTEFASERAPSMPSIRLIDVARACVVTLDSSEGVNWVALSYVWGEAQVHALKKDNYASYHQPGALNAENMPSTILDAITVTREMGEDYLWVDSLCIVQDDDEDKLRWIPAMDIIYGQSTFAIINAAADKVSSGIPGIDAASPRPTQDVFEVNGTWLTVSLDPPHRPFEGYLQNSRWYTRGWTYQECLLPRRCLIFTQEQAYWQCLGASWCEDGSWEQNPRELPIMYRHCLGRTSLSQETMRSLFGDTSIHWSGIYTMALEQYLQRQLTSEGDRLDAFTGVLRVLGNSKGGQEFFWGMPKSRLELSLSWTGGGSLMRNTARHAIAAGGVSSPFPSWSWAGWCGWFGSSITMDVDTVHSLTGLLPLRFYQLGSDGDPTPIHNNLDGEVSQFQNDTIAKLGSDTAYLPRYPSGVEHTWMDKNKTEITTSDIPHTIRSSDVAPALLCFWTSTAILSIHQEPHKTQAGVLNTGIGDEKESNPWFWTYKAPRLGVTQGKFIVVGGSVQRPSRGGQLLLNIMLVEENSAAFDAAVQAGATERAHTVSFGQSAITNAVANMLFSDVEDIDRSKSVAELGVDNLIAAKLRNSFLQALATSISMLDLLDPSVAIKSQAGSITDKALAVKD
ncbi:Heterokaryon incompatibility [Penicillium expansum]|nr:Heterokaryon incompatibility [Penicillium expansum]